MYKKRILYVIIINEVIVMNIKFIHCSDLHLGCTPAHLDIRYNDFFDSFRYLINKAIEENCKYILIS